MSSQYGDVEHILPRARYPNLYAEWTNLSLACVRCNNAKKDREGYINPFSEDPSEHIHFRGPMVFYNDDDEKAKITVRGLNLNRPALLEKRALAILALLDKIELVKKSEEPFRSVLIEEVQRAFGSNMEYSACLNTIGGSYFELN